MIPRYSRPEMSAVWAEENKYRQWLRVEIAAARAWADVTGIIPREDLACIEANARFDLDEVRRYEREQHHDVTAFLRSVSDSLGPEGRWVHYGLTSSDVVDTALALQLVQASDLLLRELDALTVAVAEKAREHKHTLQMGRTHGVHAEPTTFGLKLAAWVVELQRGRARLEQAREQIAVGKLSGPVGTHASVPAAVEERALAELGLAVEPVSSQIVHRDRHAHFVATLALIGSSLEKFATEIRGLQRTEVREVEEPFSPGQKGSSSMPHKRNPEKVERICGLARLLRGYALTSLENVALWHERDISHSSAERIIFPDACLVLDYALDLMTFVMRGLHVYPERMRRNLELSYGLPFSQRVLLALVDAGLSRDEAYELVQRNAMRAWSEERQFLDLLCEDAEVTRAIAKEGLTKLFDPSYYVREVDEAFRRAGLE
ncbi:MAG TPA: adenylosuccinate lyase [Dehalococcoidia bacterium]|nr:adenylosuccinate lyase [Dehalococcoidia bacterium]